MMAYAKAIVSAVITGITMLLGVYSQNGHHFSTEAILIAVNAALVSLVAVWAIPNKPPALPVAVPDDTATTLKILSNRLDDLRVRIEAISK